MSKEQTKELLTFLEPFGHDITDLVMWLRDFAWDLYPQANELIYDNYNAVAFGWLPTDRVGHTFCSIAAGRSSKNVHFGFHWGNELLDPDKILLGEGNQYRYILVKDKKKNSKSLHKKISTRSIRQFTCKSERQKTNFARTHNCKINFNKEAA